MATKQFVPGAGDLVTSRYKRGVFKVLAISHGGQTAAIQWFDISKQQLGGKPMEDIPCDTLLPYHDLTPLPITASIPEPVPHRLEYPLRSF